jgi:hypothetical protein
MRFFPLPFLVLLLSATLSAQTASTPQATISFRSGDSVPGASNTNASFVSFGNPAFNALNGVAFQASVKETVKTGSNLVTNTWSGIWADDSSGNRNLIVRNGLAKGSFSSFSDPVYNNSNAIAFIGRRSFPPVTYLVAPVGGEHQPDVTGIWTTQIFTITMGTNNRLITPISPLSYPPNLNYVTSLGSQAPGYTTNTTFSSFDQIALPDQGGVVMLATVTTKKYVSWIYPPTSTNPNTFTPYVIGSVNIPSSTQQGIWAQDTTGTLQLIAHQGGTLNVGGTNKTIASLSFLNPTNPVAGQTRSFNQDTGNLFYTAKFTDGTQAGVKVIFP